MNKLISIFFLVFISTSCGGYEKMKTDNADKGKVVFDGDAYWIPKKYILKDFPESLVPKNSSMDKNTGLNLDIPYADLNFQDDTKKIIKTLGVLISPYSDVTIKTEIHPLAMNAWFGKDRFEERIIEFDEFADAYRIYVKKDYPFSWQYFRASPENDYRNKNLGEVWLASCSYAPWKKLKLDYSNLDCWKEERYKTTISRISFSGDRIKDLDKLLKNYENLLRQWEEKSN